MSDIDFEELDRAVNGLLGGVPAQNTSMPTPSASPVQAPVAAAPVVETPAVIERVERTTLSSVASSPTQAAPAARRSSGRFMDMVHPSSDMRSSTPTGSPAPRPTVVAPAQPIIESPQIPQVTEAPAWNEPLESPFLPDTKVEKRPLGGVTITPDTSITDAFDFQGLLDEPDEELLEAPEPQERIEATATPDPIDFAAAVSVPEEFETPPEVVKVPEVVEAPLISETAVAELATVETVAEPVIEEAVPTTLEQPWSQPQPQPAQPAPVDEPVGPTSITPQYKEQPSTASQESGAIYDTESYHQPVVQPVKKKSGWLTVLWIFLLVAVGAGAGWAVYTFVLPML